MPVWKQGSGKQFPIHPSPYNPTDSLDSYFGICINPDGSSWLCSANASSLAAQVDVDQDPLNLIWVAQTFRESIVFPYLLIIAIILAAVTLLLLATFPGYEEEYEGGPERRRLPSRAVSQIALAVIFVAAIFVLVSVLWQHTASVAAATIAENLGNGSIATGVGVTAMVLGWFGFALLIIVTIGLLVMYVEALPCLCVDFTDLYRILSMHLVEKLTDADDL